MPDRTERTKSGDARKIEFRGFGIRAGDGAGFSGYASTSWHVDSYATTFAPGAWTKTLQEQRDKVLVLWQHDPYQPIGRPTEMAEDAVGLKVDARISEATSIGRDAMALLRDDVPLGLSVGFRTYRERQATDADPLILGPDVPEWVTRNLPGSVYVIEEARLYEFSVVSFPANLHAEIDAVRSNERMQSLAQTLEALRAGRLDDASRALIAEIAAAWQAAPDSLTAAPRTDAKARRRRHAEFALLFAGIDLPTLELSA